MSQKNLPARPSPVERPRIVRERQVITLSCGHEQSHRGKSDRAFRRCRVCHVRCEVVKAPWE